MGTRGFRGVCVYVCFVRAIANGCGPLCTAICYDFDVRLSLFSVFCLRCSKKNLRLPGFDINRFKECLMHKRMLLTAV